MLQWLVLLLFPRLPAFVILYPILNTLFFMNIILVNNLLRILVINAFHSVFFHKRFILYLFLVLIITSFIFSSVFNILFLIIVCEYFYLFSLVILFIKYIFPFVLWSTHVIEKIVWSFPLCFLCWSYLIILLILPLPFILNLLIIQSFIFFNI